MWHDQREWVRCREYWFWVTGLKRWQILMFFIVFKLRRMFISPQPDVWLRWGLDQNVAFLMDKCLMFKTQNWILPTCDSFPLIVSHMFFEQLLRLWLDLSLVKQLLDLLLGHQLLVFMYTAYHISIELFNVSMELHNIIPIAGFTVSSVWQCEPRNGE